MSTANAPAAQTALRDLLWGFVASRAIQVAASLRIADELARGPLPLDALARNTGTDGGTLMRLLRFLESRGLFQCGGDLRYANSPMSELLREGVPGSLRGMAMMQGDRSSWHAWHGLEDSVRKTGSSFSHIHGTPIFDYLAAHPESAQHFNSAMVSSSSMLNAAIVGAYDWKQFGTLVDVGGGVGSTLSAILEGTPALRGILYDLPHVIERGQAFLAERALQDRCTTTPGDFFHAVPPGGDAYLLKHILHDWGDDASVRILRACRDAMPGHARLLVCEKVIQPGTEPSYAKLMDLVMLAMTEGGRERTRDEFATLFSAAGLELRDTISTVAENSVLLEAVKT